MPTIRVYGLFNAWVANIMPMMVIKPSSLSVHADSAPKSDYVAYIHNSHIKHLQYQKHSSQLATFRLRCRKHGYVTGVGKHTQEEWQARLKQFSYHCAYCGLTIKGKVVKEHYHSVASGGVNYIWNLVPSCRRCNAAKRDSEPTVWVAANFGVTHPLALGCPVNLSEGIKVPEYVGKVRSLDEAARRLRWK